MWQLSSFTPNDWKQSIILSLLVCLMATLIITGTRLISPELPSYLSNILAGIWTGITMAFIGRRWTKFDRSWSHWERQNFTNRISCLQMILGGLVFLVGGVLGFGVVFGIDFSGICYFSSFQDFVAGIVKGRILIIFLIGLAFGAFIGVSYFWYVIQNGPRLIDKIMNYGILLSAAIYLFFSATFSHVLQTPFIFVSVLTASLTSIILRLRFKDNELPLFQKHFSVLGLLLIPLTALLSRAMLVCPA